MPESNSLDNEITLTPRSDPSALTTVQLEREIRHLRELLQTELTAMDQRYQQRYEQQQKALEAAFAAQQQGTKVALDAAKEGVTVALASAEKAVTKAESIADKRFEEIEKQIDRRITAESKALITAIASNDKSVDLAASVDARRFETVERNVLRVGELSDMVESIKAKVEGQASLTDAKFVTYRALIDSQAEKVALALAAADKAVSKAETANEKRFESLNEFRGQLADQQKTLIARNEFEALNKSLTEKVDVLNEQLARSIPRLEAESRWSLIAKQIDDLRLYVAGTQGKSSGLSMGGGWIVASLGALATIISIVIVLANVFTAH